MDITLYQILHDAGQSPSSPDFEAYVCADDPAPDMREIYHMRKFHRAGGHRGADFTGLLSPSFCAKTGVSGEFFKAYMRRNPGFDVYFLNPIPTLLYLSYNVWQIGEALHNGLTERANELFHAAGYDLDVATLGRNGPNTLLYCNYWVGSPAFWDRFMAFVGPLMDCIDAFTPERKARYFEDTTYKQATPYYPFIFERMFSTFMLLNPDVRGKPLLYDRRTILDHFCQTDQHRLVISELGDMIERWDATNTHDQDSRILLSSLSRIVQQYKSLHDEVLELRGKVTSAGL
jgi:hypothetical protein